MKSKKKLLTWNDKLYEIIYEADTPMGKLFDIVLLVLIFFSVIMVMLESIASINTRYQDFFYIAEWVVTGFFTIEYIARIIVIKRPKHYIFSFYGIVDLLSTLPSYLGFILGGQNLFFAIRALRLLRVFRILKITRYVGESHKLIIALKNSKAKILVFLFAVLIICIITGTLMHLIEGKESGFSNIPISIYWCIVTLTTVGFGDIAPVTPLGRFLAGLLMIMGYGIIAVPTGIVGAEFSKTNEESIADNTQVCPHCNEEKHLSNADFCHNCGNKLNE